MRSTLIGLLVFVLLIGGFFAIRHHEMHEGVNDAPYGIDMDGADLGMGSTTDASTVAATTSPVVVIASTTVSVSLTQTTKEFTVSGFNFGFTPSSLSVNRGDTVVIHFKNTGGFHDFKIDEFNVASKRINGGQEDTVTFVANKTGTFEYYCSVGTHRQMGMKGTLTVK